MAPEPSAVKKALPRTVVALGFASLLTDVSSEMIAPLLPIFLTVHLGAGATYLGVIEGAADALANVVKLASGRLSDRAPRRWPFVFAGYCLATAVRPLVGFATAAWQVLTIRLIDRFGKGVRAAPRDALLADAADAAGGRAAGRYFGFHRAMDHVGAIIGPLLAFLLLSADVPLRTIFLLAAVPGVLTLVALLTVKEEPRSLPSEGSAGSEAREAPGPGERAATKPSREQKRFLAVLAIFMLGNSSDAFLLLRAQEVGFSAAALPILSLVLHVVRAGLSYPAGRLADERHPARVAALGWIVYAVAYGGFALVDGTAATAALFVLYGAASALYEPAEGTLVKQLAGAGTHGAAFGLYHFTRGVASLLAGLMTGLLWDGFGASVALLVCGALAGIAALLLVFSRR